MGFLLAVSGGVIFSTTVMPMDRRLMFHQSTDDVVEIRDASSINWTAGFITAQAEVRLPRIVFDTGQREIISEDTVGSITEARLRAREEARGAATRKILRQVARLPLNSDYTILEKLRTDRVLRRRFAGISERILVRSRKTGEGVVAVELALPFFSERGLYALVAGEQGAGKILPEVELLPIQDEITGLILDATDFKEFRPSLEPRIYSDQGRLIYGPETIGSGCTVRRGLVRYFLSRERARQRGRLGIAPYYTHAAGTTGGRKNDLYLSSSDVLHLLGNKSARRALKSCAVAILVNPPKR